MRRNGFTLVEVMVVVFLTAILLAIAVPQFMAARETSRRSSCIKNQRTLDDAKAAWLIETGSVPSSVPTMADLVPTYVNQTPVCPTSGTYTLGDQNALVTCSLHARETAGNENNVNGNQGGGNNGNGNGNGGN